jgi:hypothetical protein
MKKAIKSFIQDNNGDWMVELVCGHTQHVRHQPPWQDRPWVISREGRDEMIGVEIECSVCDSEDGS